MIPKIDNVILEDDVVRLQPLEIKDFEHLLPFALHEPEIWKFSLVAVAGEDTLRTYIETAVKERDAGTEYPFVVFDKRTNRYAGSTRFYDIQLEKGSLQLGYTWYGKDFQGTGLNRHCKFLLLRYAFETLQVERVEFRADNNNVKSIAAMKSIGCTVEGVLRSHMPTNVGGRRDSIILSILKSEWEQTVKMNLFAKL
ncbi:GNAT family N-acetyltransferase [Pedobacter duraquae]|uniref:RimJ/RimL family protein N-acetyltransferase n=1 Tax=Pedobacter duraquae TaxID=425511 RepID=A0A4V3C459_9SPHI|nr:GNAT family protein [Pedobacter duraquae]TDO24658.1 RimJ/RimL family protein N-acetyltransferase [Pedobacter duraquae]